MLRYGLACCAVLLVGCGGDEGSRSNDDDDEDASSTTSSSGTGGNGGGAPAGNRLVTVDRGGRPVAGVEIALHDADGALIGRAQSDAEGAAVAELPPGGGATFLWHEPSSDGGGDRLYARSVLGLEPGDEARVVVSPPTDLSPGQMEIELYGVGGLSGADWNAVASCRDETMLGETAFSFRGCGDSATFDLFVNIGGYVQVFPNETFVLGEKRTYAVDQTQAVPMPPIALTATLPAGTQSYGATFVVARPDGGENEEYRSTTSAQSNWPALNLPQAYIPPGGAAWVRFGANLGDGFAGRTTPLGNDVPASLSWTLPDAARVQTASAAAGTAARAEVSYALGAGPVTDAVEATVGWSSPDPGGAGLTTPATWSVFVAASASGAIVFPELPAELDVWIPKQLPFNGVGVRHVTVDAGGGVVAAFNAEADHAGASYTEQYAPQP